MKTKLKNQTPFLNAVRKFVFPIALITIGASAVAAQTNTFPSSGNAGIGTLSPVAPLDVQTNAGAANTLVGRFGNNSTSGGGAVRVYANAVTNSTLYLQ